jgi:hypothetical protein
MIDRHPLKPRAEATLHSGHQLTDVLPQIDPVRVLGRYDE